MDNKKNYLVYDNEEDTEHTESLRDIFEQEETQELPSESELPNNQPVKEKSKKEKTQKEKNPKKLIEKFLIGLIVFASLAIVGVLALFFIGQPEEIIINADQQTERALFDYTAEYSQKINGFYLEIKDILLEYRDDSKTDIWTPLNEIKLKVEAAKTEFIVYEEDYAKNQGQDVFDIYVSRMFNLSKLIDELLTSTNSQEAIDFNNNRVLTEKEYVEDSKAFIKKWLNNNDIPFEVVDDKIILK